MSGALLWGWDATNKVWIPLQVDANGYIKVDMSNVNLDDLADVSFPLLLDGYILSYEAATFLWKAKAPFFRRLQDADVDTNWDVERFADEDKIRGRVKGVEAFLLSTLGILTLAKQSTAHVYQAANQVIGHSVDTHLCHDTKLVDVQNEFDNTVKIGTASATLANHLVDTVLSPFTAADVGATVWNTTDNTYATVTVFNSASDVTLSADIMVDTEGYKLFRSKFTCTEAGKYLCVAQVQYDNIADTIPVSSKILVNGSMKAQSNAWSPLTTTSLSCCVLAIVDCAANDYIQHFTKHWAGVNEDIMEGNGATWFQVVKVT